MIPAMSCVEHLKRNAKRETVVITLRINKHRGNLDLLVVGLVQNTNKAPTNRYY